MEEVGAWLVQIGLNVPSLYRKNRELTKRALSPVTALTCRQALDPEML